jgi:septal ring factor EnvC (AmiA/AmiB activator)
MSRSHKIVGFLLVTILGVYGCAKGPGGGSASDSGTANAAKVKKLEEDYRAAVAACDQFRQKLAAVEEQHGQARKELEKARADAAAERDALKSEVKARTTERDALQVQYESFRKSLKELLGQADTAVGKLNLPPPQPPAELGASRN